MIVASSDRNSLGKPEVYIYASFHKIGYSRSFQSFEKIKAIKTYRMIIGKQNSSSYCGIRVNRVNFSEIVIKGKII